MVIVEHFLNEKGEAIFPDWIRTTRELLQSYDGFISLVQLKSFDDENRTLLELRFENMQLLRSWSKSDAHDQTIDQLSEYRNKKQVSQVFEYI